MANTPSAKKRVRQIQRKTEVNKARKSRIKTFVRKVEEAIQSKDVKSAVESLKLAQPEIMRGASKGIFHKNTASRKISRLSSRVKAIAKLFAIFFNVLVSFLLIHYLAVFNLEKLYRFSQALSVSNIFIH